MLSRLLKTLVVWRPVRQTDQMLFAEALSQALSAGIEPTRAVAIAADTGCGWRARRILREMATNCRRGYSLAESLKSTRATVDGQLLGALEVGEERGTLSQDLAEFARSVDRRSAARLAEALGRPGEVIRFAAALARLLAEHRMTVHLIQDAAYLAAGTNSTFAATTGRVTEAMREGKTFADALELESGVFDAFFRKLVAVPDGREELRSVLSRFGGYSKSGV